MLSISRACPAKSTWQACRAYRTPSPARASARADFRSADRPTVRSAVADSLCRLATQQVLDGVALESRRRSASITTMSADDPFERRVSLLPVTTTARVRVGVCARTTSLQRARGEKDGATTRAYALARCTDFNDEPELPRREARSRFPAAAKAFGSTHARPPRGRIRADGTPSTFQRPASSLAVAG